MYTDTDLLVDQADSRYTAYIVNKAGSLLMGTSTGLDIYSGSAFYTPLTFPNDVIKYSYQYLTNNSLSMSVDETIPYVSSGTVYDMRIRQELITEESQSLEQYVIYVELNVAADESALSAEPTMQPTMQPTVAATDGSSGSGSSSDNNDDEIGVAANGVIAIAVFLAFIFVVLVAVLILIFLRSGDDKKAPASRDLEMSAVNSAPKSDA